MYSFPWAKPYTMDACVFNKHDETKTYVTWVVMQISIL